MCDAGRELAERSHFLRLDQIGLGSLQFPISGLDRAAGFLRRIACRTDFLLASFSRSDVGVDQYKPTIGNRIVADLDYPAIRSCSFEGVVLTHTLLETAKLRLGIGVRAIFTTL